MFIPTTLDEVKKNGWAKLDVILITADTYIDSSYVGAALLGKLLISKGFRTGIIAQPDINTNFDITRLGEPELFWGISGGCVDSMVANYTALHKKRRSDDFTPGGINNIRPDRAVIKYTNLIQQHSKNKKPIVIGGIEASLRRIAHYDYWSDKLRKSILFDSKADILVYGMGEKAIIEIAERLKNKEHIDGINGTCIARKERIDDYIELPSFEEVVNDKNQFIKMFNLFYENNDPVTAKGLMQKHGDRFLIQNPPQPGLTQKELDEIHALSFENDVHLFYKKQGVVKALDTIRFSVATHRGCYGECNFCAIAVHQGRTVQWRSEKSILDEVLSFTKMKDFSGIIRDVGGPTANMYGFECIKKLKLGSCNDKRCLYPKVCDSLNIDHEKQTRLLKNIRNIKGVKKAFVASGIRFDMIFNDKKNGDSYMEELVCSHISGQMKIAPEHTSDKILQIMGKPSNKNIEKFYEKFNKLSRQAGKPQFLTYYLIAAHPGCSYDDMIDMKRYISDKLKITPEQVQIFTPTPSTYSTLMYYTGINPFTGEKVFVEKKDREKEEQKNCITERRI